MIPGSIYKHFKGNKYQIIAVALHSETGEKMVVYQALYGDFKVYVRPYDMFVSPVDKEKYPDVKQKMRFEKVEISVEKEKNEEDKKEEKDVENTVVIKAFVEEEKIKDEDKEEGTVNRVLMEFLNADTYGQKMDILKEGEKDVDEQILDSMALSVNFILPSGDKDSKVEALFQCLRTYEKYELRRR